VEGIEFRAITVEAFKGKDGPCVERNQAVIYRGPFKEVVDDDNHRIQRGVRHAVCEKTFNIFQGAAYRDAFEFIEPRAEVPPADATQFDCFRPTRRDPKETKGADFIATTGPTSACCGPDACC
jgi:arsenite methyltransferase